MSLGGSFASLGEAGRRDGDLDRGPAQQAFGDAAETTLPIVPRWGEPTTTASTSSRSAIVVRIAAASRRCMRGSRPRCRRAPPPLGEDRLRVGLLLFGYQGVLHRQRAVVEHRDHERAAFGSDAARTRASSRASRPPSRPSWATSRRIGYSTRCRRRSRRQPQQGHLGCHSEPPWSGMPAANLRPAALAVIRGTPQQTGRDPDVAPLEPRDDCGHGRDDAIRMEASHDVDPRCDRAPGHFAHGGNPDETAEAWSEAGFEADEVEEWLNARCFDPARLATSPMQV